MTGYELKNKRLNKGMSQQGVASCLGLGIATVQRWESEDKTIPQKHIEKINRIFRTDNQGALDDTSNDIRGYIEALKAKDELISELKEQKEFYKRRLEEMLRGEQEKEQAVAEQQAVWNKKTANVA